MDNITFWVPRIAVYRSAGISQRLGYCRPKWDANCRFGRWYHYFYRKKGLLGNVLIIDHGHGLITRFVHVQSFSKKLGERIKRGDTIALVGNSGRSTGPHLHYEVLLNGVPVNPEKYFLN